jgi:hypothetical protein
MTSTKVRTKNSELNKYRVGSGLAAFSSASWETMGPFFYFLTLFQCLDWRSIFAVTGSYTYPLTQVILDNRHVAIFLPAVRRNKAVYLIDRS